MVKKLRPAMSPQKRPSIPPMPTATGKKKHVAGLLQRAQVHFQAGGYGDARAVARRVLERDPGNADAYHMLAAIAFTEQNFADAETLFTAAVGMNRHAPHLRYHLGNVQLARGHHDSAAGSYREALKLDPSMSAACFGLAMALQGMGRSQDAVVHLQRYLEREPRDADGHNAMGIAFQTLGKLDLALAHIRLALSISPDHKAASKNLATTLLLAGNFREGWPAWLQIFTRTKLKLPDPASASAPFQGKHVIIYANEGVGDEIMFASCVPELINQAAEITLHCDTRLVPLFQRSFPEVRTLGMMKENAQKTIGLVAADEMHVLASFLPAYFRPDSESFPQRESFLLADPVRAAEWRRRFGNLGTGLKVGLSWRGGLDQANRARRSIPLTAWAPIFNVPGVHFVSLQYGDVEAELEQVRKATAVRIAAWSDANPLIDLDFFAAQIAALDLVISVDNTTVHMAGALGKPVWALLPLVPDWRWRMAGTATPWYPCVQLFRQQEAGQWGEVVQQVRTALIARAATGLVDNGGDYSSARIGNGV